MEAFTLLKYWHTLFTGDTPFPDKPIPADDGPYFDLELSQDIEWPKDLQETQSESSGDKEFIDSVDATLEFVLKNVRQASEETVGNTRISAATLEADETCENIGNEISDLPSVGIQKVKGPLICLFARENCANGSKDLDSASQNKRLSKEIVHKYLKLLKPLYYVEKMKCSGGVNIPSGGRAVSALEKAEMAAEGTHQKHSSGLKVVMKHLGKSRSSSALVAPSLARRSDDTLAELQEGVQGAILYCKRSYSMPAPAPGFDSD